jgi:hypothetical protein
MTIFNLMISLPHMTWGGHLFAPSNHPLHIEWVNYYYYYYFKNFE